MIEKNQPIKISCSWEILIKAISSTYLSNLIFSHVINSKDRFRNWISFEKFSSYFVDADLSKIKIDDQYIVKFRILLLKELLLKVNAQYKELIGSENDISTSNSALECQKIRQIFDYKNTLEKEINILEIEII